VTVLGEDLPDHPHLLVTGGIFQAQQQDARMGLSGMVDKLAKILIHRQDQSLLPDSPREDVGIVHTWVGIAHGFHVMARASQPVFDRPSDPDVREHPEHRAHTAATG
jgi:hypothetical protein